VIVEVLTFRLDGDEGAFAEADSRFQQEVAYQRPGILRRTTAKGECGEWCVVTLWDDGAEVDLVPPMADESSVRIRRYRAWDL
jgi:hypothetical protein